MRGRRRKGSSEDAGNAVQGLGGSCLESNTDRENSANVSRVAVGKRLKRATTEHISAETKKHDYRLLQCDSVSKSKCKTETDVKFGMDKKVMVEAERCSKNAIENPSKEENVDGENVQCSVSQNMENFSDSDWEDGSIPVLEPAKSHPLTIELSAMQQTPDSAKRKPIRRASAADKETAELVHKVHLLCLLGRGRLIDHACNNPLIQSALLSLLPKHLLKISPAKQLTTSSLQPLVTWLHNNFHVRNQLSSEGFVNTALARALETHEGTSEEIAALTVALFRALDFTTRFVSILDVASIKPETEKFESFSKEASRLKRDIFKTSTLMVDRAKHVDKVHFSTHFHGNKDNLCKNTSRDYCKSDATNLAGKKTEALDELTSTSTSPCCNLQPDTSETCPKNYPEQKRKGDIEFDMQLQMALSATGIGATLKNSNVNYSTEPSLNLSSPKLMKRIVSEESASSSHGISTAVGSSKMGSPLYWAEVYCNAENLTGKWVHVDAVNMVIDGEHKVEALAAACKTSLRYVVAFSGLGAKDVTRRYCMKWYKIERSRIGTLWWDSVLAPLRILEGRAIGGSVHLENSCIDGIEHDKVQTSCVSDNLKEKNLMDDDNLPGKTELNVSEEHHAKTVQDFSLCNEFTASRDYLEDIELETRALTEPLPTNQQAYKSHRLYAIEKWLTKYQMLHPRGPVLGYCSGHPVYLRTCVKMLKTREKWLREGLQVKSNELPVKELKHSLKSIEVQESETEDCDRCDSKGVIKLYGKWQLEPLQLPHAVNGIVPKNERGQVNVWSEKCLPPGTVHIRLPRVFNIAKRLEIDYAPAMVGFEFRNGRSYPVYDGIVVCSEFKDAIIEAYREEVERREAEEKRQSEKQAISRWYQLLSSILTRQRLNSCYGDNSSQTATDIQGRNEEPNAEIPSCEDEKKSSEFQQDNIHNTSINATSSIILEDHKHVFMLEDQIFDEECLVVTKRCHCGFSLQVEEL